MASPISASVLIAEKVKRLAGEAQAPGHCGYSVPRSTPMPCSWMNASAGAQPANSASGPPACSAASSAPKTPACSMPSPLCRPNRVSRIVKFTAKSIGWVLRQGRYLRKLIQLIKTVGHPSTMLPPCAVISPIRAAGCPPIRTVKLPSTITSGGPTHTHMSPTLAAGSPPIKTVGQPGGRMGPPTCGTSTVTIGQTCMSETLAAGWGIVSVTV